MLQEVRDIITNIVNAIEKSDIAEQFEYQISDDQVDIAVSFGTDSTVYNGFELALYDRAAKKVDPTAKLNYFVDDQGLRISTLTAFDLNDFIRSTNSASVSLPDNIACVAIVDKLDNNSAFDFSLLTVTLDGAWSRYDFSHAELVYAAVHELVPMPNERGVFVFQECIDMNRSFFDEIEAEKA